MSNDKPKKKPTFQEVFAESHDNGSSTFWNHDPKEPGAKVIAIRGSQGRYQDIVDLRDNPLFLPMSPCPWCSAINDRNHDPLRHIDLSLGTKDK
jgi:hypothetical protein